MTKLIAIGEIGIAAGIIAIASIAVIGTCVALYPLRLLFEWERKA